MPPVEKQVDDKLLHLILDKLMERNVPGSDVVSQTDVSPELFPFVPPPPPPPIDVMLRQIAGGSKFPPLRKMIKSTVSTVNDPTNFVMSLTLQQALNLSNMAKQFQV